jgi:hypothetical protein
MKNIGFATITVTGVNITTGAASASAALPVASSGEIARFYRLTATAYAHFRLGAGSATAVATDAMLIPGESLVVDVPRGLTHIAAIQDTAAGTVNVAPLEDC